MKIECIVYRDVNIEQHSEVLNFIEKEGSIFQQLNYLNAVGKNIIISVAYNSNSIVGALPIISTQKFKLKALHIPQYTPFFGPIIAKEAYSHYNEIVYLLISKVRTSPLMEFKMALGNQDILPYLRLGGVVLATQTHIISKSSNFNIDSIHYSKSRYLKKLLKAVETGQLIIKEGQDCYNEILWLQEQTAKRNNFSTDTSKLHAIMSALSTEQSYAILISTKEGEPLSGSYCPYDSKFSYYLINASINCPDSLLNQSNILSTYLSIIKAMELGLGFDFEGSNIKGIAEYYRLMGGEPTLYYRIQIANNWIGKSVFVLKQIRSQKYTSD